MSLETFTGKVSDLVPANLAGTDPKSQGDDHLRGIKTTIIGQSVNCQIGQSITPDNNFTLTAAADNGTAKLARGNAGATIQDIMTVDAAGKVAFPAQGQSLSANGYVKLPGGLIIQWGTTPAILSGLESDSPGWASGNFPIPFPTAILQLVGTVENNQQTNQQVTVVIAAPALTQWSFGLSSAVTTPSLPVRYIAIGY